MFWKYMNIKGVEKEGVKGSRILGINALNGILCDNVIEKDLLVWQVYG